MKIKLNTAKRAERKRRKLEFETIFIGGKMKRIRRPLAIDGMNVDDFLSRNADPLWLHQNGLWELIPVDEN
jgi:hypothetical protein